MKFTAEHDALRRTARQFVENELNPFIPEWEAAGRFPIHDVFKKMADLGLLGICKPEENGGLGYAGTLFWYQTKRRKQT